MDLELVGCDWRLFSPTVPPRSMAIKKIQTIPRSLMHPDMVCSLLASPGHRLSQLSWNLACKVGLAVGHSKSKVHVFCLGSMSMLMFSHTEHGNKQAQLHWRLWLFHVFSCFLLVSDAIRSVCNVQDMFVRWVCFVICSCVLWCGVSKTCQAHGRRCVPSGVGPPLLWAMEKLATSKE